MLLRRFRLSLAPRRTTNRSTSGLGLTIKREYANSFKDYGSTAEYEAKWIKFFQEEAYDQFELQRGLNTCFTYDIVPTIPVLETALRACRRLNDFSTAVRISGALREKCENDKQYLEYVKFLEPIKNELGVPAPEDIGRK